MRDLYSKSLLPNERGDDVLSNQWGSFCLIIIIIIIIIINILTAIGLAPGGSSPVHIYREHYIEYTNNTQNT